MQAPEKKALHKNYHDNHYGFPIHDDNELLGRLILEINQAGLSWETILKKEASFRKAYSNFNIKKIAAFTFNLLRITPASFNKRSRSSSV